MKNISLKPASANNEFPAVKNVMIIDDDKICHLIITKVIEQCGFAQNKKNVYSGEEALHELKNCSSGTTDLPDLIFLDINMPAMNGWEFLVEYAKMPVKQLGLMKIVMLTSSNSPIDIEWAEKNKEVYYYIEKPISKEKLQLLNEKIIQDMLDFPCGNKAA